MYQHRSPLSPNDSSRRAKPPLLSPPLVMDSTPDSSMTGAPIPALGGAGYQPPGKALFPSEGVVSEQERDLAALRILQQHLHQSANDRERRLVEEAYQSPTKASMLLASLKNPGAPNGLWGAPGAPVMSATTGLQPGGPTGLQQPGGGPTGVADPLKDLLNPMASPIERESSPAPKPQPQQQGHASGMDASAVVQNVGNLLDWREAMERSVSSSSASRSALPIEDERKELRELRAVLQTAALSVRQQEHQLAQKKEELDKRTKKCAEQEEELKELSSTLEKKQRRIEEEVHQGVIKWKEEFLNSPQARLMALAADEQDLRKLHRQLQGREDDVVAQEQKLQRDLNTLKEQQALLTARQQEVERAEEEMVADSKRHMDRINDTSRQLEDQERALNEKERQLIKDAEHNELAKQELEQKESQFKLRLEMLDEREKQLDSILKRSALLSTSAKAVELAGTRIDQRESTLWEVVSQAAANHGSSPTGGLVGADRKNTGNTLSVLKADFEALNAQLRQVNALTLPSQPTFVTPSSRASSVVGGVQ